LPKGDQLHRISLEGQSAIITGAARGIGKAHALEFARRGAHVVVNDINGAGAKETADEIVATGGSAVACSASVIDPDGPRSIVQQAVDEFGFVSILVNNAGVQRTGYFTALTDEQIDLVLATHLRAAFSLTDSSGH
jgi:NAD(P)-dependent dehydrogenase (short-subunit alcohol dehydrogenase family)